MIRRLPAGVLACSLVAAAGAANAPPGYVECVRNTGATCVMTGTRPVALGKNDRFVYTTRTGSFACIGTAFPSNGFPKSAWCSYGEIRGASADRSASRPAPRPSARSSSRAQPSPLSSSSGASSPSRPDMERAYAHGLNGALEE